MIFISASTLFVSRFCLLLLRITSYLDLVYLIFQVLFQIFAPVLQFKVLVFYQFCNNFVEYFLVFSSSYLYTANFPVFQYDYDVVHRNVISY